MKKNLIFLNIFLLNLIPENIFNKELFVLWKISRSDSQTSAGKPLNKIFMTLCHNSPKLNRSSWYLTSKKDLKVPHLIQGLAYVKLEDENSLQEALKEVERTHMDRTVKIV